MSVLVISDSQQIKVSYPELGMLHSAGSHIVIGSDSNMAAEMYRLARHVLVQGCDTV